MTKSLAPIASAVIWTALSLGVSAQEPQKPRDTINPAVNAIVEKHLTEGLKIYDAAGGVAVIMNAKTGEIVSSAVIAGEGRSYQGRDTTALIYEIGSLSKIATIAMGLEAGVIKMTSKLDAREPFRMGEYAINDYHPQKRILTVSESFIYSSNITAARIGTKVGTNYQALFMRSLGLHDPIALGSEITVQPLVPKKLTQLSTATTSYGHGINVTPIHVVSAIASLANSEGKTVSATFRKDSIGSGHTIIKPEVAKNVQELLRLNAEMGSARVIDVPGYKVGGQTSTSEKALNGVYSPDHVVTSMVAIAPYNDPKFVYLVLLDEPKATEAKKGFKTAAWNAGPITASIIKDTAPLLGMLPK